MTQSEKISICFDLDGTLVDTAPDLVRVLNDVIALDGLGETDYQSARNRVGFGARALILEAFERAGRAVSKPRADELLTVFLERYADDIARLSQPFPGVIGALRQLKSQGYELSVSTNKPGYLARPLLDALGMTNLFVRIVGSRDGVPSKPNPEHIFAATGHKISRKIIMVGDAKPDVDAARNANVPIILMAYGYADTPPAQLRADRLLRCFRDLPKAISDLSR